jgi:hypothetical protein
MIVEKCWNDAYSIDITNTKFIELYVHISHDIEVVSCL